MNTQAHQHTPASRWRIDGRIVAAYAFLLALLNLAAWGAAVPPTAGARVYVFYDVLCAGVIVMDAVIAVLALQAFYAPRSVPSPCVLMRYAAFLLIAISVAQTLACVIFPMPDESWLSIVINHLNAGVPGSFLFTRFALATRDA